MIHTIRKISLMGALCPCLWAAGLLAQPADRPAPAEGMVTLNFPEKLELKALADYVGKRQGINFVYDATILNKQITIQAPVQVPADSLMTLLDSALKMKGLGMSETGVEGTLRIGEVKSLMEHAVGPGDDRKPRPTLAVTRVIELKYADPTKIKAALDPFKSGQTASVTALGDHGILIVTDYARNVQRMESMIAMIDRPRKDVRIEFVAIKNLIANDMADQVNGLLESKHKAVGGAATKKTRGATLTAIERTNQIAVVGLQADVDETIKLIRSLDIPLGLETKVYSFTIASPDQIDRLVQELIGEVQAKRLYRSAIDQQANLLIATTTPQAHEQIESLRKAMDKPLEDTQSPIRFYKLENADAGDVLQTLADIEGESGLTGVSLDGLTVDGPVKQNPASELFKGPTEDEVNRRTQDEPEDALAGLARKVVQLQDARILADEATNTIIVVAPLSMHPLYEKLIKRLDVRRPQVQVEATVVLLDTTDNFKLGVEIGSSEDGADGGTLLNFTQFGLTTRDAATGSIVSLVPGLGFTGALLDADIADIVIRALDTDIRAKVTSRPSVLVNDNATGILISENEEPFETISQGATGNNLASFGGFAAAGTNVKITPQISEGDYLKLEYEITLSSFGDNGTDTLPPSRQTNKLESEATIPDGATIVVGGLTRENYRQTINRVPILGEIPIIEYAFSNRSDDRTQETLFVFIRAVILRDDKFKDLKILSGEAAARAGLVGDYPISEPVVIQ